jgi:predicted ATPase with chaperone activity
MLARRLTTILPAMTLAEALETTRIHRVAGLTGDGTALVTTRPCRAPHHTISDVRLIGIRVVKISPGCLGSRLALSCPYLVRRGTFFTN